MFKSSKWLHGKHAGLAALFVTLLFGLLIGVIGYREATRPPEVMRYDLSIPRWAEGRKPLLVAFLADTHAGMPDMPPARLRRIVAGVNALRPDLVLLGGDYVKGAPFGLGSIPARDAVSPLLGLRARLGVVAVLGNNDCAERDGAEIARLLTAGGITLLRNSAVVLPGISILGIDDEVHCDGNVGPAERDFARRAARQGADARDPVLLLAHEPVFAHYAPRFIDLTLAGHTHGGQMFPAITGLVTRWRARLPAARGLMDVGGKPLIVSSGVGTNNLPFRIGVPPEVVLVRLGP